MQNTPLVATRIPRIPTCIHLAALQQAFIQAPPMFTGPLQHYSTAAGLGTSNRVCRGVWAGSGSRGAKESGDKRTPQNRDYQYAVRSAQYVPVLSTQYVGLAGQYAAQYVASTLSAAGGGQASPPFSAHVAITEFPRCADRLIQSYITSLDCEGLFIGRCDLI